MRQGLGNAIGAPYGIGQGLDHLCQLVADGSSAYDEVTDAHEPFALAGHFQAVVHLHGHHGGKGEVGQGFVGQGMAARAHGGEPKVPLEASHHHHLACDIVEGHAEQGGVARLQS